MGAVMEPILGGNLGGHFGTNGKFAGTGLGAPKTQQIEQGTTLEDVQNAQSQNANSMQAQQALLAALQKQGGLGAQNQALKGLQNTAGQYQNIASGTGPNPAQAMLNNSTGQNVANQAALMAGQRGAGANVGLMARQAAMQGANTQQQAVGQGAALQAQQQLNALQGLSAVQGQQTGLANTIAGQQIGQANTNAQSSAANQQAMQNALSNVNQQRIQAAGDVTNANTQLQKQFIGSQEEGLKKFADMSGGIGQGMGGGMAMAAGGQVHMAAGGNIYSDANPFISQDSTPLAPQSDFGRSAASSERVTSNSQSTAPKYGSFGSGSGDGQQTGGSSWAGPDSGGFSPEGTAVAAGGGLAHSGGHVDAKNSGQKAVSSGNDYANDKIPAKLSEGEIVLPRSVTMSEDPVAAAAEFVRKTLSEKKTVPLKMAEGGGPIPPAEAPSEPQPAAVSAMPESKESVPVAAPAKEVAETQAPINTAAPIPADAPPPVKQVAEVAKQVAQPGLQPQVAPAPQQQMEQPKPLGFSKIELDEEALKVQQDLATAKITPKTYHDLYAEKSTQGKISTMFGLMFAGMGAGLLHQPNAVLEMMDKQIQRDLQAQEKNIENKRSFLSLAYEQAYKKAQMKQMDFQNLKTMGDISATGAQINLDNAQAHALNSQNAGLAARKMAENNMYSASYQNITDMINKMPEGPQRDNATNVLQNTLGPAIGAKIEKNNAEIEKKTGLNTAINGAMDKKSAGGRKAIDYGRMQKLIDQSTIAPDIPGGMKPSDASAANQEASMVESNRAMAQAYDDSYRKLYKAFAAGKLNKQMRDAQVATLGAVIARATAGRYSKEEAAAQANAMFPAITDFGGSREEKYNKAMEFFKHEEAATPTLDRFGLKSAFPDYSLNKKVAAGGSKSVERKTPDGRIAIFDPKTNKFMGYKDSKTASSKGK